MVINKVISLIKVYLIALGFLFISCNQNYYGYVECDECYEEKPEYGDISISFSREFVSEGIPFTIYEGNLENNKILFIDTAFSEVVKFDVRVNKTYTIKALYPSTSSNYYVVNSTDFKVQMVSDQCDVSCWVYTNNTLNVKIRYPNLLD